MRVREIQAKEIIKTIRKLCMEANTVLGDDVIRAYEKGLEDEESELGKDILRQLLENAKIAREEKIALCQDTGLAVVFVAMGQDVHVVGGDLNEAINELQAKDPRVAEVVKLRFFVGLNRQETADALRVSIRTVDNDWAYAKAWLQVELARSSGPE